MYKKSLKNTIILNLGAFLLVLLLEILSSWLFKDNWDTTYDFYTSRLNFTIFIMGMIWLNHFVLIPVFYDKRKYFIYGVFLIGGIFIASYIKTQGNWVGVYKSFFFLFYTTGTGMAAFFLRRNAIIQKENDEKEKLQKEMELTYLKEQVNPHFLF